MADVSYQGENNYFTFKSNYQHQMSDGSQYSQPAITTTDAPAQPQAYNYPSKQPAAGPYNNPSPYYPSKQPAAYSGYNSAVQPEEQSYYYPSADQRPSYRNPAVPDYPTRNKYGFDDEPAFYPERTTTTAAPVKVTTTEAAVTTTVKAAQEEEEEEQVEYGNKPDYSVPMYPLYRADFYSARAKSGKTVTEPQSSTVATSSSSGYGVDEEGYTYIKPSAKYSVPDKLGAGYEVNHRKATMRKPTYSDYQAPQALQI